MPTIKGLTKYDLGVDEYNFLPCGTILRFGSVEIIINNAHQDFYSLPHLIEYIDREAFAVYQGGPRSTLYDYYGQRYEYRFNLFHEIGAGRWELYYNNAPYDDTLCRTEGYITEFAASDVKLAGNVKDNKSAFANELAQSANGVKLYDAEGRFFVIKYCVNETGLFEGVGFYHRDYLAEYCKDYNIVFKNFDI